MKVNPDRGDLYVRPRINDLLERGIKNPEVIVSAPAGFGKTKAVSEFLASQEYSEYRGVWHHLTVFDNIPSRFWASFIYTISLHRKELSEHLKELGFPDTIYKFDKFLRLLTKELYLDEQFVVFVFDDYHLIEDEEIQKFFEYLVSANLENISLIKITRQIYDKPIHSDISEIIDGNPFIIDTEDLRFTEKEGVDYFRQQIDFAYSTLDLSKLYSLTNGWPMALYLLCLQLKKNETKIEDVRIDSQQMIINLIESEIFSAYSDEEQFFYIQLSILNFCSRELLYTLFSNEDYDIDGLLSNNPFVIFDATAKNYYLHQIFIDFLSEKQYLLSEDEKINILIKSAKWCKENAYYADATEYYYLSKQYESIFMMIESFDTNPYPKNETEYYIDFIEKMPEQCMIDNPMYRIIFAILLLNNLEISKSLSQMDIVFDQLSKNEKNEENKHLMGEAYAALGVIRLSLAQADFVDSFQKAKELLPDGSSWWKADTRLVNYRNILDVIDFSKGSMEKSLDVLMKGMPLASEVLNGAGYGSEILASAEASYFTGDINNAKQHAFSALYKAEEKRQYDVVDNSLYLLLRIYLLNGEIESIEDVINKINKRASNRNMEDESVADIALSWFYSDIEQLSEVSNWIFYVGEENQLLINMDKDILLRVRCLIQAQQYFEAMAMLDRVEQLYIKKNTFVSLIYIHVYRAVAYYGMEDEENAFKSIELGYRLANDNNIIIPFIEFGHKTRAILRKMISVNYAGIDKEWLEMVHTKASTYAKRHAYLVTHFAEKDAEEKVRDSLTSRERKLLLNLSQGLTREEIAESMFISPHTVKSLTKTVYNKIGAINNADAVRIAASHKLI